MGDEADGDGAAGRVVEDGGWAVPATGESGGGGHDGEGKRVRGRSVAGRWHLP